MTETNTGYGNSGVIQRLHLAGTVELSYTESNISTDLNRVTNTSDGFMDTIHSLRNSSYADMVVLIGEGYASLEGACGVAWLMGGNNPAFATNAFAVVDRTLRDGLLQLRSRDGPQHGPQPRPDRPGRAPAPTPTPTATSGRATGR